MRILPLLVLYRPIAQFNIVLLPLPVRPQTAILFPFVHLKEMSFSAGGLSGSYVIQTLSKTSSPFCMAEELVSFEKLSVLFFRNWLILSMPISSFSVVVYVLTSQPNFWKELNIRNQK